MGGRMGDRLELVLSNEVTELERLATAVDDFIDRNGLPSEIAFKLNLCFDELITNTVSYGYGDGARHDIHVRVEADGQEIRVEVEDDATAFNPFAEAPAPDLGDDIAKRRVGGLGVFLVQKTMDSVTYQRDGDRNFVRLVKALPS